MREDEELTSAARGTRTMKLCSLDTCSGGATITRHSNVKTTMMYIHAFNRALASVESIKEVV